MRLTLILITLIAACTVAGAQETSSPELELPEILDINELSFGLKRWSGLRSHIEPTSPIISEDNIDFINQHILSGDGKLTGLKTDNNQLMGRWSKNYLHETLSAIYFFSYQLQYGDRTHSPALRYAINDFWSAELNLTIFDIRNNKSPNQFIDNWDQLSLRLSVAI